MRKAIIRVAVLALGVSASSAFGDINLELRPVSLPYEIDDTVEVGLYAVSDDMTDQASRGMQVVLTWDPTHLELFGVDNNGPYAWAMSGFFDDSGLDGLNNTFDDGDAYYQAAANFTESALATPEGLLVTTFEFRAMVETSGTQITLPPDLGGLVSTTVFGDPGEDVTGALGSASVAADRVVDWGNLALVAPEGSCCFRPGETVTILLTVSDLLQPINGVQSLLHFDRDFLTFTGITPGDGEGSPWDSASEVYEVDEEGLTYALVLLADGSDEDAVVATIEFVATFEGSPEATEVGLLTQVPPLLTELTDAATAERIIPELRGPLAIKHAGNSNGDASIDLGDYSDLAGCMTGPGLTASPGDCCCFDFDWDGDVDLADYAEFAKILTTP